MFLKRSEPATSREYAVCVRHGETWTTEVWSAEQWQRWLNGLTPRQLVNHMAHWQNFSDRMPTLRNEFGQVLADARHALNERECSTAEEA